MTRNELDAVLKRHAKWLRGAGRTRANLRWANLREANLCESDLRWANLREANLCESDLRWANLCGADLRWANLRGANLYGVDLRWVDLRWANLRGANLYGADLRGANLCGAIGWHTLTITEHGYLVGASWRGSEWRILAGCRDFSIAEARAHCGSPDYHLPASGSRIVALLDWLEKQPTPDEEMRP